MAWSRKTNIHCCPLPPKAAGIAWSDWSALALLEYRQDLQARSAQGFSLWEMARDARLENVMQRLEVLEHAQRTRDAIRAIARDAQTKIAPLVLRA